MSLIGRDRPGLVESIAAIVAEQGGNWLESRMSRLGGQFAGILRVEAPEDKQPALVKALETLKSHGLSIVVQPDATAAASPARLHILELVGQDRPGIVRQISGVLASSGLNVEEFDNP